MEDVQQTFAEISHTYRQLGFKPSTNLTIVLFIYLFIIIIIMIIY
jgi:hypothetical protein